MNARQRQFPRKSTKGDVFCSGAAMMEYARETDMTDKSIEQIVDDMTLAEQVALLSGEDFWSLPAIPRLGVGKLRVTDGPNGARGGGSLVGGVKSASFPVGIALGATWNPDLVYEIGGALAEEAKSKGAHVLLGPTINIQRSVTNGRNFECYSEDPVLTAALAVAYVEGLQDGGVAATPKHFAGNESEIQRTTMNSEIDERTLREVYLLPFEAVVKRAGAWALMSAYNKLNGTYTAEHRWLLTEVLRGDWGFDGAVMSDWFGSRSTAPTINAGLDLEMPGPPRDRGAKLIAAVAAGEVEAAAVRRSALNVLRLMQRTGALHDQGPHRERADDRPAHRVADPPRRSRRRGAPEERRHPAARQGGDGADRGDRAERPHGADHGRRLGAAKPALPHQSLGRLGRRARRRRPLGLRCRLHQPPFRAAADQPVQGGVLRLERPLRPGGA